MTKEETIETIENGGWWDWLIPATTIEGRNEENKLHEAIDIALAALRPITREQVEKMWKGKWDVSYDELNGFTYVTCSKCGDETVLNGCFVTVEGEPCGLEGFCHACGAPMTDEAVQMVMERLEALKDGTME